jgi:hypothetical protein
MRGLSLSQCPKIPKLSHPQVKSEAVKTAETLGALTLRFGFGRLCAAGQCNLGPIDLGLPARNRIVRRQWPPEEAAAAGVGWGIWGVGGYTASGI